LPQPRGPDCHPLVCVGETLEQRDQGVTMSVIERQIAGGLVGLPAERVPQARRGL
jgi:triosephosphate isomerase